MILTYRSLEFLETKKGGYTKKTLACLGLPYPPLSGWRKRLYGTEIDDNLYVKAIEGGETTMKEEAKNKKPQELGLQYY